MSTCGIINYMIKKGDGCLSNEDGRYSLKIRIEREVYYNSSNGFGVYAISTREFPSGCKALRFAGVRRYESTMTGVVQHLDEDKEYNVEVEEEYSDKYQRVQFRVIKVEVEIPTTAEQIRAFLGSIITKNQTDTLMEHYPNIIEMVLSGEEIDISVLKNFNEKRLENVVTKIKENYGLSELLAYFSPYGITFSEVKKIATLHSDPKVVKKMVQQNPYVLLHVSGFGFVKVDNIGLKLRPELKASKERVKAFIFYTLDMQGDSEGHTWLLRNDLLGFVRKSIPECLSLVKDVLEEEALNPNLLKQSGDMIGRMVDYNTELAIYKELERINKAELSIKRPTIEGIESILKVVEEKQGFELSIEQRATLSQLSEEGNVMIVSGSSGTGKTSVVNAISEVLEKTQEEPIQISQIALSAKAAIRMRQVTGRTSTTIHKFLWDLREETNMGDMEDVEISEERLKRIEELRQIRGSDVIIMDEFSMVNICLTLQVLKEVKSGAILIFVFDYAQLPSIGAGAVAYDLLEHGKYKKSKYTEVHRQGLNSGILVDANTIRNQKSPIATFESSITTGNLKDMTYMFRKGSSDVNKLAIKAFMSGVEKFGVDNINIITPRKNNTENSAEELNKIIQNLLIPQGSVEEFLVKKSGKAFRLGDRVIHRKNQTNVFNGEMGVVVKVTNDKDYPIIVKFEYGDISKTIPYTEEMLDYLQLSYALTVHSYQGSENKAIIVVLDNASHILLDNTMLYTAITRAKERCIVIAEPSAFNKCIKEHKTLIRNTWLKDILVKGGEWD